ncbi:MAG: phosphoethanolamine transferase [Akkermansiaceae bacterium]|nr:phosphoethanolamine transferase [Akkermansiaceae bacterium]
MAESLAQRMRCLLKRACFGPWGYWGVLGLYTAGVSVCYAQRAEPGAGMPWEFAVVCGFIFVVLWGLCRRRGSAWLPPYPLLWGQTALAVIYVACCNIGAFVEPLQMHVAVWMTLGCLCILWACLRYGAFLLWGPFLLLQLAQFAAYEQYGTRLNSLVIAESLEASAAEIAAYMSAANILLLLFVLLAIVVLLGLQLWLFRKVKSRLTLLTCGSFFIGLSCVCAWGIPRTEISDDALWPVYSVYELVENVKEAVSHNNLTVSMLEALPSPAQKPTAISTLKGTEGVVLVLHIGESVRADHMSLNGYERDTTPWLRRCKGIINFPNCISAACDTCQAQIAILTNARRGIHDTTAGMQASTGSVLDLFSANGFRVYAFFGRKVGQQLKYDRVIRLLTRCAESRFNAPGSPWTALPQIQDVLQRHASGENLVLFINNEGSHTPFYHFDEASAPFTPFVREFENPADRAQEVKNAYDNTIHYTDEFVRRVAEQLQGRPFVYVYVSDHGEYLGHDNMWGRGALGESAGLYHATSGCRVGMFIFASPEFEALHPHFAASLQRLNQHASMQVGHEHIFHSLLGLFHIETPYYNPQLDLCADSVLPYFGPAPAQSAK